VNDIRRNTLVWMALAFAASLGLAASIVAAFGIDPGLSIALRATARLAFLIFLPAYVGGPLTSLFGNAFLPLRQHARDLGLAFASAMVVHLGLVIWLCAIGAAPPVKTFVVFGLAAVSIYLLALLSVRRVRELLPQKFWPPLRVVTTNYIALAFIDDFKNFRVNDFYGDIAYLPFAVLAIGGVILTLVAWARAKSARRTPIAMRTVRDLADQSSRAVGNPKFGIGDSFPRSPAKARRPSRIDPADHYLRR
jgi:hypothetical protein